MAMTVPPRSMAVGSAMRSGMATASCWLAFHPQQCGVPSTSAQVWCPIAASAATVPEGSATVMGVLELESLEVEWLRF